MAGTDAGSTRLTLLVIRTGQPEAVTAFYRCLGVDLRPERHGRGPAHHAGRVGEVILEVYPLAGGASADTTTRLGFAVGDLAGVLESLRGGGTAVLDEPRQTPWGVRALVRDPDGRAV